MKEIVNFLTVDVEDYFMVSAFSDVVGIHQWGNYESRIESNTLRVLNIIDKYSMKGTFFILGWVAEHYPEIVKEIDRRGHEVACHSYCHRLVYTITPEEFREDTRKAKAIIESIIGKEISGYRAPSYSITENTIWALEILEEEGFKYDSSIFPIRHDRYGFPAYSRFPRMEETGTDGKILEVPLSTIKIFGENLPVCGGGYLRMYPLWFTHYAIRKINEKEKRSAIVYVHPWELDPDQPRLRGTRLSMFRHYINLGKTESRLESLLGTSKFQSIRDIFQENTFAQWNNG
jgi:polysaccharide deacetylase family protein (PEP-CTERM system associated)